MRMRSAAICNASALIAIANGRLGRWTVHEGHSANNPLAAR